ncbi:MAG: fibronectin type III domain-containing protein [Bacteroidaceae bacterium]|nr:fibronectin type III domain-containing protein [Bacteroidaceae bacterium]
MKKYFIQFSALLFGVVAIALSSCSEDDNYNSGEETFLAKILNKNLIKFTEGIGEWETAVIYEEDGYILYKEEKISLTKTVDYFQIESPDGDYDCAILADQETLIPQMLIMGNERYNFIRKGSDKLYISRSTEEGCELIDSLQYSINNEGTASRGGFTFTTIEYINRDDKVKKVVKALDAILSAGDNYTSHQIKELKKALDKISTFYYYENVEEIIDELDLCREEYGETGNDVIWCFTQYATEVKVHTLTIVRYGINVKTGMPPLKVTENSAIVYGEISCSDDQFYTLGRWGIIYSRNKNLSMDNYEGIVYATKGNFEDVSWSGADNFRVTLNNLKPNTTYYYAAFYQFNSSDHGDLHMPYGDKKAESYADIGISPKDFTTKKETEEDGDTEISLSKLGWSGRTINGKGCYVLGTRIDDEYKNHHFSFTFDKDGICTDAKYNIEFTSSGLAREFASAIRSGEWILDDEEDDYKDEENDGFNIAVPMTVYNSGNIVYIPLDNFIGKTGASIKEGLTSTGIPQDFIYGNYDATKGEYICNNALGIISNGNDIEFKANITFTDDRKVKSTRLIIIAPNTALTELLYEAFYSIANMLYQKFGIAPEVSHIGNTLILEIAQTDNANLVSEEEYLKILKAIDKILAQPFISMFVTMDE